MTDADVLQENKKVRYDLLGAGSHKFKIDNYGILRVRSNAKLDCERKCRYFLKVSKLMFESFFVLLLIVTHSNKNDIRANKTNAERPTNIFRRQRENT